MSAAGPCRSGAPVARRALAAAVLSGCTVPPGRPAPGGRPAGEATIPRLAALAGHDPVPGEPDAVLRWTALPPGAAGLRAVVHLHGFAAPGERLRLLEGRLPGSGLVPPPSPPTLGILLRGRPLPGQPGRFDWPSLASPGGLRRAVAEALGWLDPTLPAPSRLLLTAHSGGGAGLLAALAAEGAAVDEAHLFDALHRDPAALLRWAALRQARDGAGALVAIARPGGGTERPARALAAGLARAGLAGPRWRALLTAAPHNDIPRLFGPALLADPAATLPGTVPA